MELQPWDYGSNWDRIVAIGDVHGDLDALLRILIGSQVFDGTAAWMAPSTLVVLIGDLNDRGPDSTSVVSFVMRLQQEAEANGGKGRISYRQSRAIGGKGRLQQHPGNRGRMG